MTLSATHGALKKSAPLRSCYLALGSNLHSPIHQIKHADELLRATTSLHNCSCSSLYRSKPMVPRKGEIQPDYINAVMHLRTTLAPEVLLALTRKIERRMGRLLASPRWSSRIIDIDILSITGITRHSLSLTLPHPGLLKRSFVLFPLAEIAPQLILPNNMTASDYAARIKDEWDVQRLSPRHDTKGCE